MEVDQSQVLEPIPEGIRKLGIDLERVRRHVIKPPHAVHARSDRGRDTRHHQFPPPGLEPQLHVPAFGQELHEALQDKVVGYGMQLREAGIGVFSVGWRHARTAADGALGWSVNRGMHVASVSKLVTAAAMQRLLVDHSISFDAAIVDFLPAYWHVGTDIDKITFRQLLTHHSGLVNTQDTSADYDTLMRVIATGAPTNGAYRYDNVNYGLCRVLLAVIDGVIPRELTWGAPLVDALWDVVSTEAYSAYVRDHVFAPAGVASTLLHGGDMAFAYAKPTGNNANVAAMRGWISGDLTSQAGAAGWHLSIEGILDVMSAIRRGGAIVADSEAMLDARFGIDDVIASVIGRIYGKNGLWIDTEGRTEQCVVYFLPRDMELAVFVSSALARTSLELKQLVTDLLVKHIH